MSDASTNTMKLAGADLRREVSPDSFDFNTTAGLEPLVGTIGQDRALEAIETGLDMSAPGFNVFAAGLGGTGRNSTIRAHVNERAENEPVPSDWCYVNNFDDEDQPLALELSAGKGRQLADDMEELIRDCTEEIPKAFEKEEHARQKNEAMQKLKDRQSELLSELQKKAKELDHDVKATPAGITATPLVNGEPVEQDEFARLDKETKEDLQEKGKKVQQLVAETLAQVRREEKKAKENVRELDRQVANFAAGHLVENLQQKYEDHQQVVDYLKKVQEDIIDNIDMFKPQNEQQQAQMQMLGMQPQANFDRYRVNVLVDRSESSGAPVVDERNPTYYNLFGRLEYRAKMNSMVTGFNMIKGGAVHRANGGYLIVQVLDLLRNPFAYEALKRTLRTGRLRLENMWEQYQALPAATLRPDSIPINVKVILVGSPLIYHLLYALDEEFRRLFKIKADFDVDMPRTEENLEKYAQFVSARCRETQLPPFDRTAVARLVEHSTRVAGRQNRLSACFLTIADVVAEAGSQAGKNGEDEVTAEHVDAAIEAERRRSRLLQDRIQRAIDEDLVMIDTDGSVTGQVNGLSVHDMGDYRFGMPSRITCVSAVGRGGVVNIERESKMSGSIHDKGVLILGGFMQSRFGQDKPLTLSASLCFEQNYGGIDGDSASCAELYGLLSSLAELSIRQDVAVTGSVNQRGQVQPIGGVNEKIEGFFEVCRQRGLTGEQGVMIPRRNQQDLMLRQEVVDAVDQGNFHIWAVNEVTEGVEILMGVEAGERKAEGGYPEDTVFGKADARLREMAETLKSYISPAGECRDTDS